MEALLSLNDPFDTGLWRSSWQASVLAGLVLLVQWLFGNRLSPGWRYGLWLLVLARLALPFTPESKVSIFNAALFDSLRPSNSNAESFEQFPAPTRSDTSVPVATSTASKSSSAFNPNSIVQSFSLWIPVVWILGVLLHLARIFWQNFRFSKRVKDRVLVTRPDLIELLEECKTLMQVRLHISLFETPHVRSPALYGLFRPRLLLPENLVELFSRQELRHVLLHELAHVKRSDMVINWLMTVLQSLHWFNPVVLFAFKWMKADRELACDALALASANEADTCPYGETIIKLLEGFTRLTATPSLLGILEEKNQIRRRIRMIANFETPSRRSAWAALLLVGVGCVGLTDARTPSAAYSVSRDTSGDILQARKPAQEKNATLSDVVTGRVIPNTTAKATLVDDLIRSKQNQPTGGAGASAIVGTTKADFIPISSANGDLSSSNPVRAKSSGLTRAELGGTGGVSAGRSALPANVRKVERKLKTQEPRIAITDRFPMGALHLILPPERLSATQNVAPDFDQTRVPLSLAQGGDAPSQFATIRIRPDRTRSVQ